MQVVAFKCSQVFNEVVYEVKVGMNNFCGICAICENFKCEYFSKS
jgi:hypothetical protein